MDPTLQAAKTTPVNVTASWARRTATTPTSVPDSTSVAAADAPSTAARPGLNQVRRPPVSAPGAAAASTASADRVGGSATNRATPAATMSTPTPSSATVDDTWVATITPAAGPTMNETSTPIESRE